MAILFNKERGHVDVTKQMFIDFFETNSFIFDEKLCDVVLVANKDTKKYKQKPYGLEYSGINHLLKDFNSDDDVMEPGWGYYAHLIQDYYDNLYKEMQDKLVIKKEQTPNLIRIMSNEVKNGVEDEEFVYVPEYVENQDGQPVRINTEIKKKIVTAFTKNISSILNSTKKNVYIDAVKKAIKSGQLKIIEVHDKQAGVFTAVNAQVQLIFCGDKVGIKLKDSIERHNS